ncbi:hypothetical protein BCV19_22455 [Vibrio splendidus]|uniref:Uncharacterized protein n=1 Tax=Vibrio splendidus TaxID=29497 RepID=A0A2N7CJT0_VIBSP|nr:hypothetical protein BCV19_22455 [Vibrio splendidus]
MYLAFRKSRRADASNRDAGCEELEEQIRVCGMRDASNRDVGYEEREEQIRVTEMRDTKSGKSKSELEDKRFDKQ